MVLPQLLAFRRQGVPPPLLISDASCLDVVERLRRRLPYGFGDKFGPIKHGFIYDQILKTWLIWRNGLNKNLEKHTKT